MKTILAWLCLTCAALGAWRYDQWYWQHLQLQMQMQQSARLRAERARRDDEWFVWRMNQAREERLQMELKKYLRRK